MSDTYSVIIPTHNRLKLLTNSLSSAINQNLKPKEIIVSDNLCQKEVKKLIDNLNFSSNIDIKYIGHNKGGRGAISRNLAADLSTSKYIAFLDDDDIWNENYLFEANKVLKSKKIDLLYTWTNILQNKNIKKGKKIPLNLKVNDFFLVNPGSIVSNLIINKSLFLKLGGFDESTNPPYDKDLIIRHINNNGNYFVLKKFLVTFRNDNDSKESNNINAMHAGYEKLYQKHYTKLNFFNKFFIKLKILILYKKRNNLKINILFPFVLRFGNFYYRVKFLFLNLIY